ncbi:MAG: Crp/Fnr family transcriptional regulator [Flavobacteriales bacterium]|nr:Crp/Fnr family transcriptional regulator [Flavobacteriales bacterium]MBP9078943.1 Crp/Fnr family transcriptional regulator [Flavobacteriales bacterium]
MHENGSDSSATLEELIRQYCYPEWRQLLKEKNIQTAFAKGQAIFTAGEKAGHMYMVHRGRVKVVAELGKGPGRVIRLAGRGEVLGHRGLGDEPVYAASAVALAPTVMNVIPMPLFLSTLKANGLFCYHFLMYFAARMRQLDRDTHDLMVLDVARRVVKVLLLCRDTFGMDEADPKKLAYTLSRRDIASMADTTYESVVRALAALHRQKMVELVGKEVRLRKPKALERMLKTS